MLSDFFQHVFILFSKKGHLTETVFFLNLYLVSALAAGSSKVTTSNKECFLGGLKISQGTNQLSLWIKRQEGEAAALSYSEKPQKKFDQKWMAL